ncbi:hypothetical protein WA026_014829 [Henosepilachna vigintioctopunctata]|uniref:PDZ domain-containing protein n=1 Tax=Henosepilachna vigintioctopunctata TaxID=420089 RepID=A0AAW1UYT2_9CUCU
MSLYPSLEDMKVDHLIKAQQNLTKQTQESIPPGPIQSAYPQIQPGYPYPSNPNVVPPPNPHVHVYPALKDFMGLELSEDVITRNMPEYGQQVAIFNQGSLVPTSDRSPSNLIAPLSNQTLGLQRAQVSHGIRELILCKDKDGKVGLRVKAIDNGIFVTVVVDKSPAALVGLRFGDQILQINGTVVAGFTMEKVHNLLKKCPQNGISVVVRDRPFERTITLHKDSGGIVGFQFKNGKITSIIKDSSAARNGVLIEHQLLEIDGQNVVGLKDKELSKIISDCQNVVTITVIPSFIYEHMIKKMSGSLLKELMDHSIPNI